MPTFIKPHPQVLLWHENSFRLTTPLTDHTPNRGTHAHHKFRVFLLEHCRLHACMHTYIHTYIHTLHPHMRTVPELHEIES